MGDAAEGARPEAFAVSLAAQALRHRKERGHGRFVADPVGCIARIYARFGLELRRDVEARMHVYVANHPRNEHGQHHYGLEPFGLDQARVADTFKAYCEHFRIEPEPFD